MLSVNDTRADALYLFVLYGAYQLFPRVLRQRKLRKMLFHIVLIFLQLTEDL